MSLFQLGSFILSSGRKSPWKIECDALTPDDWTALAVMASEVIDLDNFGDIIGVPTGGEAFAAALRGQKAGREYGRVLAHASMGMRMSGRQLPRLIVDDVLTTGRSIIDMMDKAHDRGLVAFARGPLPNGVEALFRLKT